MIVERAKSVMESEGGAVLETRHVNAAMHIAGLAVSPKEMEEPSPVCRVRTIYDNISMPLSKEHESKIDSFTLQLASGGLSATKGLKRARKLMDGIGDWAMLFFVKSMAARLNNDLIATAVSRFNVDANREIHPRDRTNYVHIPSDAFEAVYGVLEWAALGEFAEHTVLTELVPLVVTRLVIDSESVHDNDIAGSSGFLGKVLSLERCEGNRRVKETRDCVVNMLCTTIMDCDILVCARKRSLMGLSRLYSHVGGNLYGRLYDLFNGTHRECSAGFFVEVCKTGFLDYIEECNRQARDMKGNGRREFLDHVNQAVECFGISDSLASIREMYLDNSDEDEDDE